MINLPLQPLFKQIDINNYTDILLRNNIEIINNNYDETIGKFSKIKYKCCICDTIDEQQINVVLKNIQIKKNLCKRCNNPDGYIYNKIKQEFKSKDKDKYTCSHWIDKCKNKNTNGDCYLIEAINKQTELHYLKVGKKSISMKNRLEMNKPFDRRKYIVNHLIEFTSKSPQQTHFGEVLLIELMKKKTNELLLEYPPYPFHSTKEIFKYDRRLIDEIHHRCS